MAMQHTQRVLTENRPALLDAWRRSLQASATTSRIGYFDADHTGSDGFQYSYVREFTESGFVAGLK